jgi:hypothetical protein
VEVLARQTVSSIRVIDETNTEGTHNKITPYNDATFLNRMIVGNVKVATTAHRDLNVSCVGSKDRHLQVNAETVARKFRCGIETAQRPLI